MTRTIYATTAQRAAAYTVIDALFDLTMDNLEAMAITLKQRGIVLEKSKADQIIRKLNECLGGQDDDEGDESSTI